MLSKCSTSAEYAPKIMLFFLNPSFKANFSCVLPGTKANFNLSTKHIVESQVEVDNYFAWMDGVLIIKNNDIDYIMKRLSRYYNVKISISNSALKNETFSGYLDLNDDIENVFKVLKESTALVEFKRTKINEIIIN